MSSHSIPEIARAMAEAWNAGAPERVIALAAQLPPARSAASEDTLWLLGAAQQATGRTGDAAATFRQLTQLHPGQSACWNNLGVASRQAGDLADAEQALLQAQSLAPRDAEVKYNLGLLYIQQRRWLHAREALLAAVDLAPDFVDARLQAAHACHVCGDNANQEALLQGAGDWPAQPAEQALVLSSMLSAQGRLQAALQALDKARLAAGPGAAAMRLRIAAQRVALHERSNQLAQAEREILALPLAALDALPAEETLARVDGWRAHAILAVRRGDLAAAAALYERVLGLAADHEARAGAWFGLAQVRDRQKQHAAAWGALRAAHAEQLEIAREVTPDLLAPDSTPLAMADRVVTRAAHAAWRTSSAPDAKHSPVFVVGFPRSGTTLLEQMLDAHPAFRSMDERAFLHELTERMELAGQRYPDDLPGLPDADIAQLRALYFRMVAGVLPDLDPRRLVDKNPLNMLCLPMIMRLFPEARIILCVRHPCDVLLSCSMQPFRSPAFMVMCSSPERLARGYAHAFARWYEEVEIFKPQVLEWRYESVVHDFQRELTRLARFLGIDGTATMAGFAEHARRRQFISTPSYAQVTEGIYHKSVGRWEAYRGHFKPVLPVLRPWIERFGYTA